MKIKSYPLKAGKWYPQKVEKKWVVWHGTAGRTANTPADGKPGLATTSIDAWNSTTEHIGAPWLVDRDGTIYSTFDDSQWIYHLGIKGSNGVYDKGSVGIEFANELGLAEDNGKLYAFGSNSANAVYTGASLQQDWRTHKYWARLDEAQVDAGIALTLDICKRFGIKPAFYHPSTTFDYPGCFEKASIVCHSNCRADKEDLLLEDWAWQKIEAAGIEIVK